MDQQAGAKLIKSKHIYISIVAMVILSFAVIVIPNFFGYKLLFVKYLEVDINQTTKSIELLVSIVSSILAVVAILVAINIPQKIAHDQNRIALFEKRYDLYKRISKAYYISYSIKYQLDGISTRKQVLDILSTYTNTTDPERMKLELIQIAGACDIVEFLFHSVYSEFQYDLPFIVNAFNINSSCIFQCSDSSSRLSDSEIKSINNLGDYFPKIDSLRRAIKRQLII